MSATANPAPTSGPADRPAPPPRGRRVGWTRAMPGQTRARRRRRLAAAAGLTSMAALLLAACGNGGTGSGGSATSANITWWGWTPSVRSPAVHQARSTSSTRTSTSPTRCSPSPGTTPRCGPRWPPRSGPDVFDVAPGAANGSVETYGPDAVNLEPAVAEGARQRLAVQALPDRRLQPDGRQQAGRRLGRRGVLRHRLDQPEPVQQVPPDRADHAAPVGQRLRRRSRRTASAASSRASGRPRSTRTPCRPSRTTSSPAYGPRRSRARSRGPARSSSRR